MAERLLKERAFLSKHLRKTMLHLFYACWLLFGALSPDVQKKTTPRKDIDFLPPILSWSTK